MCYQRDSGQSIRPVSPIRYILTKYLSLLIFLLLTAPSINFEQQRAFAQEKGENGEEKTDQEFLSEGVEQDATDTKLMCLKTAAIKSSIAELKKVADLYAKKPYAGNPMPVELFTAIDTTIRKEENEQANCEPTKLAPQTVAAVVQKIEVAANNVKDFSQVIQRTTYEHDLTAAKKAEEDSDAVEEEEPTEEETPEKEGSVDEEDSTAVPVSKKAQSASFDHLAYQTDSTLITKADDVE